MRDFRDRVNISVESYEELLRVTKVLRAEGEPAHTPYRHPRGYPQFISWSTVYSCWKAYPASVDLPHELTVEASSFLGVTL